MRGLFQRYQVWLCALFIFGVQACQQEDSIPESELCDAKIVYSDDIYTLKKYAVERHPTVCRNGCGIDIYHIGNSEMDTMYFDYENLPAWHPNNPTADGETIIRSDSVEFQYDLLFYNEFLYNELSTGDYAPTGYVVIFLYTNPIDDSKSTKAAMIGQGIDCFNAFNADSLTADRLATLSGNALVDLSSHRIEVHTTSVDGTILPYNETAAFYKTLVIGDKFHPNAGGIFDLADVSDESQINYQPVFLVRTREGLYAKFMVTRYKGVGQTTMQLTLQWQALKTTSD